MHPRSRDAYTNSFIAYKNSFNAATTASPNSLVFVEPLRSAVRRPLSSTLRTALSTACAAAFRPREYLQEFIQLSQNTSALDEDSPQEHGRTQDGADGVGDALAGDVGGGAVDGLVEAGGWLEVV